MNQTRPLLPPLWRRGHCKLSGIRILQAKTCSGRVRARRTLAPTLSPPTPSALPIPRLTIQYAAQRQAARHAAKTLARIRVRHDKRDITSRPVAQSFLNILLPIRWALTLARRRHASCRYLLLAALPITPVLLTAMRPSRLGRPITPAGFDMPPPSRCVPATVAAIACLRMGRPEGLFTAFEKTTPSSTNLTRLLPCPADRMQ